MAATFPLDNYELADRYRRESGRVFLTGTQALVRIALMQRAMDQAAGLNTAGFISGYRGSPLGAFDQELWRAKTWLDENNIEFLPAVNEDLAATAILGSQQVETDPYRQVGRRVQYLVWQRTRRVDRAPVTHSSMATPTAVHLLAVCWSWQVTITAACRRPCHINRMWRF